MATLTLTTPVHVGDLVNGITVDKLDLSMRESIFRARQRLRLSCFAIRLVDGFTRSL